MLSGWSWYSLSSTSVRQGIYIWKGVSKLQIVIVFSAKKKKKGRVLLKLSQLCLVMEDNLPQENNGHIYLCHVMQYALAGHVIISISTQNFK